MSSVTPISSAPICAICQEDKTPLVPVHHATNRYIHHFHHACILQWLEQTKKNWEDPANRDNYLQGCDLLCPTCRSPVRFINFHPINFTTEITQAHAQGDVTKASELFRTIVAKAFKSRGETLYRAAVLNNAGTVQKMLAADELPTTYVKLTLPEIALAGNRTAYDTLKGVGLSAHERGEIVFQIATLSTITSGHEYIVGDLLKTPISARYHGFALNMAVRKGHTAISDLLEQHTPESPEHRVDESKDSQAGKKPTD